MALKGSIIYKMASPRAFFKKTFLTGLFVLIPAVITVFVVVWFFGFIDGILAPLYDKLLRLHVPGLGFISAIILIFIVGIISKNVIGKRILGIFERLFLSIPVFKGIYTSVKQIVDAFSPSSGKGSFKEFVVVEYPRSGTYAFGFLTKECSIKDVSLKTVYIPTNNLYLGEIVLFKKEDIFYTDIPVEEGIKIVLSGGIATPKYIKGESR